MADATRFIRSTGYDGEIFLEEKGGHWSIIR
jgi:hypothetical protein